MQSSMYYLSRWEEVIYYSTNPRESVRLLKLIALAIEVNYKPFYLTGLSYFQVSTQTVLKVKKRIRCMSNILIFSCVDSSGCILLLYFPYFNTQFFLNH